MIMNSRVGLQSKHFVHPMVNEIDSSMLLDTNGKHKLYIGRGSFGIVRLQLYRGIHVAVKELLPKSVKQDIIHEAEVLARLCHPYLPCLFGVCTQTEPLRIVMQFHGFLDGPSPRAVNLQHEVHEPSIVGSCTDGWLIACAQILEAVEYLHNKVNTIHNDIKENNILLGQLGPVSEGLSFLTDFGKATPLSKGKRYYLSSTERVHYRQK